MNWGTILTNTLRALVGRDAAIYALAGVGMNLQFGYTGLLNFGQVGFMAVGAYSVAISSTYYHWHPLVGLLVGIAAAVTLALVLGLPALRLRADYLAIVTIATGEIIRLIVRSVSLRRWSGGSNGLSEWAGRYYALSPFDKGREYGIGPLKFFGNRMFIVLVTWAVVLMMTLFVGLLVRSPWGRVLRSVREDEDAARALGKNAYWYKVQSLVLGGVIGSFAGMLLAIDQNTAQPDVFARDVTFFILTALILGGAARIWSPIVGSMIFWGLISLVEDVVREAERLNYVPDAILKGPQVGQVRFMMLGLALCLLMIFRPQGIFGDRNEMALQDH